MHTRLTDVVVSSVTAVDQFTRECLLLHADFSMTGVKVAPALEPIVRNVANHNRSLAKRFRISSKAVDAWAWRLGVQLVFITPGRPVEKGSSSRSTVDCGMNASMSACSSRSPMFVSSYGAGRRTTITVSAQLLETIVRRTSSLRAGTKGVSPSTNRIRHSLRPLEATLMARSRAALTGLRERPGAGDEGETPSTPPPTYWSHLIELL